MRTFSSNNNQVEEVYEQIEKVIETIKGEENLIIMGDWNAIVGEGKRESNIMGKCGLEKGMSEEIDWWNSVQNMT